MSSTDLLLSVVLLTWNSKKCMRACLSSVIPQVPRDSEIIVVDNGSADGTWEELVRDFPQVKKIRNLRNLGVAPARNQGLSITRGRYILLLDIDTIVTEGAIEYLLGYAEGNFRAGLVAPRLVSPEGDIQPSCRQFPTLVSKLQRAFLHPSSRGPREDEYPEFVQWTEPREVDYAIGACQLIRRVAIDKVGFLDANIFYGPEDADFCMRLWANGWKVIYLPRATVVHWEQRVTRRMNQVTLHHVEALAYFFWKHRYLFSRRSLYRRLALAYSEHGAESMLPVKAQECDRDKALGTS